MADGADRHKNHDPLLQVGEIVGTHGLRGDLKVKSTSETTSVLLKVDEVVLEPPTGAAFVAGLSRQVAHKKLVLLRLRGFETIELADPLVGSRVLLPESALPELDEDEYYWSKLSGSRVIDRQYGDLGLLVKMFTTGAHDTYVVRGGYGEVLIPAVKKFILSIDLEQKLIQVDLPEGLVPEKE